MRNRTEARQMNYKNIYEVPLSSLRGISTAREKLFAKIDVFSVGDLLNFYPRAYEDRGNVKDVLDTADGETVSLVLEVVSPLTSARIKANRTGRPMTIQKFVAADDTGSVKMTFFNSDFLKSTFTKGRKFRFYGTLERTPHGISMSSPSYEPYSESVPLPPFVPIYPLTAGLTQKIISSCVRQSLEQYRDIITETLDEDLLRRNGFIGLYDALCSIHFPKSAEELENARRRLAFEELYDFHLKTMLMGSRERNGRAVRIKYPDMKAFAAALPFTLTTAQKMAIQDILIDITLAHDPQSEKEIRQEYAPPARRLVQGDVGSGKTIVACAAIYAVAKSGYQSALMAPTGILARQHYESIGKLLGLFGIKTVLLTGGMKAAEKRETLALISSGEADVVIGTHALIEDGVEFRNLALAITDEQHRFGVAQRKTLENKSENDLKPHVVVMSATPIPRTLAMIMYCDLDISIIDQMPKGRQPIETYAVGDDMRGRVYKFIAGLVEQGRQAYIVCPLAEQTDTLLTASYEMKSAKEYCDSLAKTPLSGVRTEYIHGKMKQTQKDEIMARFADGEIDVLVSTTVIEVGVNVPNAVVMLIENAERFGLSQLHQLRGRVGRGSEKSYCILMSPLLKKKNTNAAYAKRMDIICKNTSGFVIAEKDLELRGPGEFFGRRQSGIFSFKIASAADMELVYLAKAEAEETIRNENLRT